MCKDVRNPACHVLQKDAHNQRRIAEIFSEALTGEPTGIPLTSDHVLALRAVVHRDAELAAVAAALRLGHGYGNTVTPPQIPAPGHHVGGIVLGAHRIHCRHVNTDGRAIRERGSGARHGSASRPRLMRWASYPSLDAGAAPQRRCAVPP
ncbi:unnamed protein product, partial [Iphiclides podalirius]